MKIDLRILVVIIAFVLLIGVGLGKIFSDLDANKIIEQKNIEINNTRTIAEYLTYINVKKQIYGFYLNNQTMMINYSDMGFPDLRCKLELDK